MFQVRKLVAVVIASLHPGGAFAQAWADPFDELPAGVLIPNRYIVSRLS